jgi:clan AA aspartic protease (TIGR02281 family)
MGIEDWDWFSEKKLNYDYDDSYGAHRFGRRDKKPSRPPGRFLMACLLIIFLSGGLGAYLHFSHPDRQAVPQQQYAAQNSSLPPAAKTSPLPPSAQPAAAELSAAPQPARPEPPVALPSTESQTLHYYKRKYAGMKLLTAEINDIPFEVMLDTGASSVALNSSTIQRLGISRFTRKITTSTAGGPVAAYPFQCDSIKLGTVTVHNVACEYVPTLSSNLLGNSFLSNFSYTVNDADETITLVAKHGVNISTGGGSADDGAGWAEIDGKKYRYENGGIKEVKDR